MQNLVNLGFMARYWEISKVFPLEVQVKLVTPVLGPQGHNLGTLCRGPLDKTTCKFGKSRPYGWVQGDF